MSRLTLEGPFWSFCTAHGNSLSFLNAFPSLPHAHDGVASSGFLPYITIAIYGWLDQGWTSDQGLTTYIILPFYDANAIYAEIV